MPLIILPRKKFQPSVTLHDLVPDMSVSSGINWTRSGNTYTTTGKYCSILFKVPQTSGKVFMEFIYGSSGPSSQGCCYGVQRPPTRVGNYHGGTTATGNGGIAVIKYPTSNVTHSLLLNLNAQTVSFDGAAALSIGGSGQLYIGIYDSTISDNGYTTTNWGKSAFTTGWKPADAIPIGQY